VRIALALLLAGCATVPLGPVYARGGDRCRVLEQGSCDLELCWPARSPGALRVTSRTCREHVPPVGAWDEEV
jgi:hypothetical protein